MTVLRTRTDPVTKTKWAALAKAQGVSESVLLRRLVATVLQANPAPSSQSAGAEAEDEGSMKRLHLRLRGHEARALEAAAKRVGTKPNGLVVDLIRSAIYREPRATEAEVLAIRRSNDELAAIGRNLNQIAHAMHKGGRAKGQEALAQLDNLRDQFARHVAHVSRVLDVAENRWEPGSES